MTTNRTVVLFAHTLKSARRGSVLRALRDLRRALLFPKLNNAVSGVYASFTDAREAVPRQGTLGYDSERHASMYDYRVGQLFISDYAVLFWLSQIHAQLSSVFDLGGHTGVLYYGFKERLKLADSLRWVVQDVPTTVERGRELARSRDNRSLEFTTAWEDGSGSDLLLASGVLQYLDWNMAEHLDKWKSAPRYILVNNTPMYEGPDYITLQNTGISYNPYRIFNRAALIGSLEQRGFVLRDTWRTDRSLDVPFHPERRVESYQGFFMERSG